MVSVFLQILTEKRNNVRILMILGFLGRHMSGRQFWSKKSMNAYLQVGVGLIPAIPDLRELDLTALRLMTSSGGSPTPVTGSGESGS